MLKIYELPTEIIFAYERYESLLTEAQGELTPEVEEAEKAIESLMLEGAEKVEACAMVLRNLEIEADDLKEEAEKMLKRRSAIENNADRLKKLVGKVLPLFGNKVKTTRFTIWNQTNPPSYELTISPEVDLYELANKFPDLVKVSAEPCKKPLTDLFKAGFDLPNGISVEVKPKTYSTRIT